MRKCSSSTMKKLIRWSVRRQLEEWSYTAFEAESGAGALAQIRTEVPDLILLDVRLPDLSGIEVLREIKQNNLGVSVIMITGDPHSTTSRPPSSWGPGLRQEASGFRRVADHHRQRDLTTLSLRSERDTCARK